MAKTKALTAQEKGFEKGRLELYKQANEIKTIKTQKQYDDAELFIKACAQQIAKIHDYCDGDISDANKLHKSLTKKRRDLLDPFDRYKRAIAQCMVTYDTEQERKRREREEKKRLALEEKQKEKAKKLRADGDKEKAKIVEQTPVAVTTLPSKTKREGLIYKDNWVCIVDDMEKLPDEFIIKTADMTKLNGMAKHLEDKFKVAGARAINMRNLAVRNK